MRSAGTVAVVVAFVALGLGDGELLAQAHKPAVASSMSTRTDLAEVQALAWDWLRANATATPFIVGLVLGVVLAEVGRFILRWLMRTLAFLNGTFQLVLRHRLVLASVAALVAYAAMNLDFR